MAYALEITCDSELHCLTLVKNKLKISHLQKRIRQLFELPAKAKFAITYTDADNDEVTLMSDRGFLDALIEKCLNPLRIQVTLPKPNHDKKAPTLKAKKTNNAIPLDMTPVLLKLEEKAQTEKPKEVHNATPLDMTPMLLKLDEKAQTEKPKEVYSAIPLDMKRMLHQGVFNAGRECMKLACQSYQPLVECVMFAAKIGLLETYLEGVAAQLSFEADNGVATAIAAAPEPEPNAVRGEAKESGLPLCGCKSDVAAGAEFASSLPSAAKGKSKTKKGKLKWKKKEEGRKGTADATKDPVPPVHHGSTCCQCGVCPIVGFRWRSILRSNIDLCHSCHEDENNEYTTIDVRQTASKRKHTMTMSSYSVDDFVKSSSSFTSYEEEALRMHTKARKAL